jgi:hypothetical protein
MKSLKILLIALNAIMFQGDANAAEYDMNDVNQKIKAITDKKLHLLEVSALDEHALFESSEFIALQAKCSADWIQIISNIDKIDGGDSAKKLAIFGLSQLSAQDYMTAVETFVTKYESGSISEILLEIVVSPTGRMSNFLTDNFNHPRVIAVLNRIKVKSTNLTLKSDLNDILSGADKTMRDDFREAHAGLAEGNSPIVILPP